jgi:ribosomal protein S18 acetylase RimI-like enzyme
VTRLAVLPEAQGRGIVRWCMARAEALARERGCAYLRLDVHGRHTGLARFYERLGYEPRGIVAVRSPDEPGLLCFEKRLAG